MNQFETANITYKGLTDGKLTVTLLDEKKGKWTIWKKGYQTDEDSEPYQALQNFKFGDTFGVSYQEKDESFTNEAGKVINFKKRTIYQIMPIITEPTATMQTSRPSVTSKSAPQATQTYKAEETPKDSKFWDDKALKQSLWGYWKDIKKGQPFNEGEMAMVARMFNDINSFVDSRETEITGKDIPF